MAAQKSGRKAAHESGSSEAGQISAIMLAVSAARTLSEVATPARSSLALRQLSQVQTAEAVEKAKQNRPKI